MGMGWGQQRGRWRLTNVVEQERVGVGWVERGSFGVAAALKVAKCKLKYMLYFFFNTTDRKSVV